MLNPHFASAALELRFPPAGSKDMLMKMTKREFLKGTGAVVAASMMAKHSPAEQHLENWAGNITYSTDNLQTPTKLEEVRATVKKATKLRALATRHSFNTIADSNVEQISLRLMHDIAIDEKAGTVTVDGGVTYGLLAPVIDAKGFALHNLASLPHISVAGAIATATHGSGLANGNLATPVSALEIVTANGEVIHVSREKDGDQFLGAVVGLGALGVVTRVTLNMVPTFDVSQSVYQNLSFDELEHNFNAIFGAGYSVSLFTDWQKHQATQVWIKRKLAPDQPNVWEPEFHGATMAMERLHPITGHPAESCTEQMGIPGPWYDRLPHFRIGFTPSSGRELQTEYLVPLDHAYEAILAVEKLRDQITPLLFVTELRTIAPDDLWMSTAYQRPSLAIHFTWKPMWPEVKALLPQIEAALEPFAFRPHWGKLFTVAPATLQSRYTKLAAYKEMVAKYDPTAKFRNEFLDQNLYAS